MTEEQKQNTYPAGWKAALQTRSSNRAALSCLRDRASQRRSTQSVPPVTNQGLVGCGARALQEPVCPCGDEFRIGAEMRFGSRV